MRSANTPCIDLGAQPLVSAIVIFFNAEKFIQEAIESVLAQTYGCWELLLVDDGSSDGSTAIAHRYAERHADKIKYLDHANHQNRGMSATRNLGIRNSHGEFLAFLDADDIWLPDKLARQVAILESQPSAAMVYGASQYWYSWTGQASDATRDYVCDTGVCPDTLFQPGTLFKLLLAGLHSPGPSDFMVRCAIAHQLGGFEESFTGPNQLYEDQAFLAKVYLQAPVLVSNECWDRYRIHDNSCGAVVTSTGQLGAAQGYFLNWLRGYLTSLPVAHGEFNESLDRAMESCVNDTELAVSAARADELGDTRRRQWWLRVESGNAARLELLDDGGDAVNVAVEKAGSRTSYEIQLNQPRLAVDADQPYRVSFMARAEPSRCIVVGCAESYPPWSNLGLYRKFSLNSKWQSYEARFVATNGSKNARIHFDIGNSKSSIDLRSVRLLRVEDNCFIEPDILPVQMVG